MMEPQPADQAQATASHVGQDNAEAARVETSFGQEESPTGRNKSTRKRLSPQDVENDFSIQRSELESIRREVGDKEKQLLASRQEFERERQQLADLKSERDFLRSELEKQRAKQQSRSTSVMDAREKH